MKICKTCLEEKPLDLFDIAKSNKMGRHSECKPCRRIKARDQYSKDPFLSLERVKRSECKKKGFNYNLDYEFLKNLWTGVCPITGEEITIGNSGRGSHQSGHLDRLKPEFGYVKGNVLYISGRMNRIKLNATSEELRKIADWMDRQERATTIPTGSTSQAYGDGNGKH